MLKIKRIYDDYDDEDGYRILVDRLWPRGMSKEKARLDEWAKEISPSDDLRKEFHHVPDKFDEFVKKYELELKSNPKSEEFIKLIEEKLTKGNVTLLFGAKDVKMNNAVVLKDLLDKKLK